MSFFSFLCFLSTKIKRVSKKNLILFFSTAAFLAKHPVLATRLIKFALTGHVHELVFYFFSFFGC